MKRNKWITRLALIVAIAALIFSVVTLIRSITVGSGVVLACILVVGTALIVAICAMMLYVLRGDAGEKDEPEDAPREPEPRVAAAVQRTEPAPDTQPEEEDLDRQVDALLSQLENDHSYDLHNFE